MLFGKRFFLTSRKYRLVFGKIRRNGSWRRRLLPLSLRPGNAALGRPLVLGNRFAGKDYRLIPRWRPVIVIPSPSRHLRLGPLVSGFGRSPVAIAPLSSFAAAATPPPPAPSPLPRGVASTHRLRRRRFSIAACLT